MHDPDLSRLALLIAFPLTAADFERCVARSHWLRAYRGANQSDLEAAWLLEYEPLVAQPMRGLVEDAEKFGVRVVPRADLHALEQATRQAAEVVILLAHWKGADLPREDIQRTLSLAELGVAAACTTPLGSWIRDRVEDAKSPRSWRERLGLALGGNPRPHTAVEILTAALDVDLPMSAEHDAIADVVVEDREIRRSRRREELDAMLADVLVPGNRLELYDGLHAKHEVERAVASDFVGTLDLATCNSTFLADFIATRRGNRIRTVQFPAPQEPAWLALCLRLTLGLVATGIPYAKARHEGVREVREGVIARKKGN